MALQVAIEVEVTVNGASHNFGSFNVFADVKDAREAALHEGVARGVAAKLESLYAPLDKPQDAAPQPEAQAEPVAVETDGPEHTPTDAHAASPEDVAALEHAERLRNELRASRARSVETAAVDERTERGA